MLKLAITVKAIPGNVLITFAKICKAYNIVLFCEYILPKKQLNVHLKSSLVLVVVV